MFLNSEEVVAVIDNTKGRFFSLRFEKKSGAIRFMLCRTGVVSALHGGELKYNPNEYGLRVVYDMINHGYRTINLDKVLEINFKECSL
jgi:hypothetical protein